MGYHKGDAFEKIINISNKVYQRKGIALVQKIPTPMKPIRRGKQITSAYYEEKSTLDYIGVYEGVPIAFDAKETKEENRFPLGNIQDHQIEFMKNWYNHGGLAFLLIHFTKLDTVYRLDWLTLSWYWKQYQENRGKRGFGSIAFNEFECNCKKLRSRDGIMLDYLEGIESEEIKNNR
ncbi:Holliday junction resolvase RecU [Tissierella praeacuta]|uniref:Holliday junction resolvase RecU n=1 Tax=Tissierella praeacuta TaxID=43131 RepID=UPI0028AB1BF6|nr:Holliday junction resolvase RecU [Tissierella praeacuta]